MMSAGEMRRVTAINNGTVIDHIPAGTAPVSYTHLTLPTTPYV